MMGKGWHAQARRVRRADRGSDEPTEEGGSGRVREGPPGAASAFLFGIARHGAVGNAYDPLSLGNLFLP